MLFRTQEYAKRDDKVFKAVVKAAGGSEHDLPFPLPNMKPSNESEFWGWRSSQEFSAEIWLGQRLIKAGAKSYYATVIVYWLDVSYFIDGGFAVVIDQAYPTRCIEYFKWGACEHVFQPRNTGNCQHRYTCARCNKSFDVDSSG